MILRCIGAGSRLQTSSVGYGELMSTVVPLRAKASTSMRSRSAQWWTPMKPAWVTR